MCVFTSTALLSRDHPFSFLPQARKVEVKAVEFNRYFIARMIPKLDWSALKTAADSVK